MVCWNAAKAVTDDDAWDVVIQNVEDAFGYWDIIFVPEVDGEVGRFCTTGQDHRLADSLDVKELLPMCAPAIERGEQVRGELPIVNTNRVVGTITGGEVTKRHGPQGLPDDTVRVKFHGSAGQSFGAFVPPGMTLELAGDANDYFGKGLSGGKLLLYPPEGSTFTPRDEIIAGNVAFYGATGGEAYIRGMAGERFCVRNSGVKAVVESVGDHGCEYMTGGCVVVLGRTGRNFAAGMSGGVAYVYDEFGDFAGHCNTEMVDLLPLAGDEDVQRVRRMIDRQVHYTDSALGREILADWDAVAQRFVKVYPRDYRRMQESLERAQASGLTGDEAVMEAFTENVTNG